jgi:hypothetical protein
VEEHQSGVPSVALEEIGTSVEYAPVQLFNQAHLKKPCSRESNNINANGNKHANKIMIMMNILVLVVVAVAAATGATVATGAAAAEIHPEMLRQSRGMTISINRWIFYGNLH